MSSVIGGGSWKLNANKTIDLKEIIIKVHCVKRMLRVVKVSSVNEPNRIWIYEHCLFNIGESEETRSE